MPPYRSLPIRFQPPAALQRCKLLVTCRRPRCAMAIDRACCKQAFLHACAARGRDQAGSQQLVPARHPRFDTLAIVCTSWRGRPRGATLRRRSKNAAHRPSTVVVVFAIGTRVAARRRAKSTSTKKGRPAAPGRRGPRGPIRDTIPKSPASPTGLPVGDDAALCFAHHSQPHRRRKPKHEASRRSRQPPDPVDTVGAAVILRAAR